MKISRRSLFSNTLAGAAMTFVTPARTVSASEGSYSTFDPWVEIRPDHVRHNVAQVRDQVDGRPILAVIKNNAYGMGLTNMGRILDSESAIAGLAVVKLSEAIELRDAGITKPILLMGPFDELGLEEVVMRDVIPMVYTPIGDALEKIAAKRQSSVPITVCVDTGMGRVGVPHQRAAALIADLAARPAINIKASMMALNEDAEYERIQFRRFEQLHDKLQASGISMGLRHAASSYNLFQSQYAYLDMVRPGMALFGHYSAPRFRDQNLMDLRPSMSLKARVIYVKHIEKGDTAGYHTAYTAEKDVWTATIPAGHVDGVPRIAANGGWVRIGGKHYPIIAAVSSSHTIVEVGAEQTVRIGDVATYFDWRDGSRPEDASAASGVSVYDLIMHLNPTLPKRIVS